MSATQSLGTSWSNIVVARLTNKQRCPYCESALPTDARCRACGLDLSGADGHAIAHASFEAASAVERRRDLIQGVFERTRAQAVAAAPAPQPVVAPAPAPAAPSVSTSLQSVLAIAGAGLFGVAAIVFAFFTPDLAGNPVRLVILGAIAVLFLIGASVLARRRLQFSAEALGALGMVFLALTLAMTVALIPSVGTAWQAAAVGTAITAGIMLVCAVRVRIRAWLWLSVLALAVVPAMFTATSGGLAPWIGFLLSAITASALIDLLPRLGMRMRSALVAEQRALTAVQFVTVALSVISTPFVALVTQLPLFALVAAAAAVLTVLSLWSTRHLARRTWSFGAGAFLSGTVVALMILVGVRDDSWMLVLIVTATMISLVGAGILAPLPRTTSRAAFFSGTLVVSFLPAFLLVLTTISGVGRTLAIARAAVGEYRGIAPSENAGFATPVGLAVITLTLLIAGRFGRHGAGALRLARPLAAIAAGLTAVAIVCIPTWGSFGSAVVALMLAGASGIALLLPRARRWDAETRGILIAAVHAIIALAIALSWHSPLVGVALGIPVIAALTVASRLVPAAWRPLHVGFAYAYALVVIAEALSLLGFSDVARLSLTSLAGSLGAIAATFLRRLGNRSWTAVLIIAGVPYALGVAQVVVERSPWTALATAGMFALTLTLVLARVRPVSATIRTIAAAALVPTIAVAVVCLSAQLPASGSPIALPVIAAIVALALTCAGLASTALRAHRVPAGHVPLAVAAMEASALLTGAISVVLALVRSAAGLPTSALVLVLLALGGLGSALLARRLFGWVLAGAAATGALWCLWALAEIGLVEAYLLPPTLGLALVGIVLTATGRDARVLYIAGLGLAIVPLLLVLARAGTPEGASAAWRAYGLVAAPWALTALALWMRRANSRLTGLLEPTLMAAIVASLAAVIQSVRWGTHEDGLALGGAPMIFAAVALAVAGAVPAAVSGAVLARRARKKVQNAADAAASAARPAARPAGIGRAGVVLARLASRPTHVGTPALSHRPRTTPSTVAVAPTPVPRASFARWATAPAVLIAAATLWPAIERNWTTVWIMWTALVLLGVLMVVTAARSRTRPTILPPVPFVFVLAFVTAIVAWSPRDLRVEWFSLPLGLSLLTAGAAMLGAHKTARTLLTDWPRGFSGSWPLLAPGLIVTVAASITATFTDPLTWRAILVIVLALLAILWGARAHLAAPFVLGVIVLPIENVFVFAVQFGRGIESMPWWITLAVVGAVLLILAVTYERREEGDNSLTARLRDLT